MGWINGYLIGGLGLLGKSLFLFDFLKGEGHPQRRFVSIGKLGDFS